MNEEDKPKVQFLLNNFSNKCSSKLRFKTAERLFMLLSNITYLDSFFARLGISI